MSHDLSFFKEVYLGDSIVKGATRSLDCSSCRCLGACMIRGQQYRAHFILIFSIGSPTRPNFRQPAFPSNSLKNIRGGVSIQKEGQAKRDVWVGL